MELKDKIKILFYSHTIDFGGTWRSHERILLNLNKKIFQPYVFFNKNQDNNRLEYLKTKLDNNYIIEFDASKERCSAMNGYSYTHTNFEELCIEYNFDIIHFARSGYYEWPFINRLAPIQIETNIFGHRDNSPFLDYSITISDRITELRNGSDCMIYNPIPTSIDDNNNLFKELNLSNEYNIFGRIGRKDNFHPIALEALKIIKNKGIKFKYIIIGACDNTINYINYLGLNDDCIILETTNDDYFIHKFYNTIDLFLHYRSDGESFGTAIAQSLSYGKPVISHYAGYNAQKEILLDGGFVVNNSEDYSNIINKLLYDKLYYNKVSTNAKKRFLAFEQSTIVKQWEEFYLKIKITY
jgi:hypothetical protein